MTSPHESSSASATPPAGANFLGHPVGLYVLFLTQMWERFSYFGMLALLIIYLNKYFKLPQEDASTIFKWYTSVIYFTPLVGAYLADRYLGNKLAVLFGAVLMAVGHFLMAFPTIEIFYAALIFLVVGFGLLTPPLTTQVGLLYPPHDPRRDSGYTIFYMGINLGAFVSPLLCGWLVENTQGRFHSGFTLAGIGMVIALLTYLAGLRWVIEVDQGGNVPAREKDASAARSERAMEQTPSVLPWITGLAPRLLMGLGILLAMSAAVGISVGYISWDTVVSLVLAAVALVLFGWIAAAVHQGLRDRVVAILLLIVFSIFYWTGAGQSGNTINLWAEQNTDRSAPPPNRFPEAAPAEGPAGDDMDLSGFFERWTSLFQRLPKKDPDADKSWSDWWIGLWHPVPTAWFQSINPLLILLLAPVFAWLWTWLGRRGLDPSIPTKMGIGLLAMALAFGLMWIGAEREARETSVAFQGPLPAPLVANAQGQVCRAEDGKEPVPYHAGRLFFDASSRRLRALGVFPDIVRDQIAGATAPADFVASLEELQKKIELVGKAQEKARNGTSRVHLGRTPPGFDLRYAGLGKQWGSKEISYDPDKRTLATSILVEDKEMQGLKVAAADPELRSALDELMVQADFYRVSPWWLLGFFLLATVGELCLSPVGMSMVSQLAPARFTTMLMGLWLLTFAFGNYLAGALGEKWGVWPPVSFFAVLLAVVGGSAILLFALSRTIRAMMHEEG